MKKFLALALILTLALSVSVFAAKLELNSDEGVASFEDTLDENTSVAVLATVGGIQHRYAVDLDYTQLTVSVTGSNLVWDVNDLVYKIEESEGDGSAAFNNEGKVTFTNRSDMPVDIAYDVEDLMTSDLLAVTCKCTSDTDKGETVKHTLAKATTDDGETKMIFTLTVAPEGENTWTNVANYYANYFSANNVESEVLAIIGFTVSMTPVTPEP